MNGVSVAYDAVDVANLPAGSTIIFVYIDGYYQTAQAAKKRFPNALLISLTTGTALAVGIDVEPGNANATKMAQWAALKVAAKVRPLVYCARLGAVGYGWQWCIEALAAGGVSLEWVDWFIADATGTEHMVDPTAQSFDANGCNVVATQWGSNGGYDISAITNNYIASLLPPTPSNGKNKIMLSDHIAYNGKSYQAQLNASGNLFVKVDDVTTVSNIALPGSFVGNPSLFTYLNNLVLRCETSDPSEKVIQFVMTPTTSFDSGTPLN